MIQVLRADARSIPLADESVDCVVTSPPYWGLRDYGVEGQLGLERLHDCLGWARGSECQDCHVCAMRRVFREVHRVLKPTGTLWMNYGDSYCNTDKWGGGKSGNTGKHTVSDDGSVPSWAVRRKKEPLPGLKPKDLVGMAWRIAFALQAEGWWLRNDIIWSKPNPMPESCRDRATKAHEYLFLLAKAEKYHFDQEAWKEPCSSTAHARAAVGTPAGWGVGDEPRTAAGLQQPGVHRKAKLPGANSRVYKDRSPRQRARTRQNTGFSAAVYGLVDTRNRRTVWSLNSDATSEAHFATFPEALVEPCILAGCPKGGLVLDPFCGSGTTLVVANRLGCSGVGLELNPEYIEIARRRVFADVTPNREEAEVGQKVMFE